MQTLVSPPLDFFLVRGEVRCSSANVIPRYLGGQAHVYRGLNGSRFKRGIFFNISLITPVTRYRAVLMLKPKVAGSLDAASLRIMLPDTLLFAPGFSAAVLNSETAYLVFCNRSTRELFT